MSPLKIFILEGTFVLPLNSGLKITCSAVVLSSWVYFLRWMMVVKIHTSSLASESPYQPGYKWDQAVLKAERKQNVLN